MLQCARAITQRLKEAEEALAQLKGVTGGRLNVAVISAGDYFFPRVLAAFGAAHPGITFNLTVHNREGLLRLCTVRLNVMRSEEHTSELQSQSNLVCRLLLEKTNDELVP